jgi:hypothetical protein
MLISFLLASSLNIASVTMLMVNFPSGAELLRETTTVSQSSGKELISNRACNSSSNFNLTLARSFTIL